MGTTVTTVATRLSQTEESSQHHSRPTADTSETTRVLSTATWTRTSVTCHHHALPSVQHRSQVIDQLPVATQPATVQPQPRAASLAVHQQHQLTHSTATTQFSATETTLPHHSWTTQATSPRTTVWYTATSTRTSAVSDQLSWLSAQLHTLTITQWLQATQVPTVQRLPAATVHVHQQLHHALQQSL